VPGAGLSLKGGAQRARREWRRVRAQAALDDPGMTVAEVLAWVGDLLSDYAERFANEAYLGSARDGWLAGRRARAELGIGSRSTECPGGRCPISAAPAPMTATT